MATVNDEDPDVDVSTTFDQFAGRYGQTVDASVGFVGKDLSFFVAAKIHHLRRLGRRVDRPLAQCSVLDVGCGTGVTDTALLPHVGRLCGVDVSAQMVAEASKRNPQGTYEVYNGDELPFDRHTFDLVFAICVVHHVPPGRWDGFVAQLWRVTRPGGMAIVIEHNPLNPLTRRSVRACPFDEDAVLVGPRRLMAAFRRAGAQRVRHDYILFAPFGGERTRTAEHVLRRLPVGAQHVVHATSEGSGR